MNIFGWDYPAGCSSTPFDEEWPCEMCGNAVDDCVCPECPLCGAYGDPACYDSYYVEFRKYPPHKWYADYKSHGMIETNEQVEVALEHERLAEIAYALEQQELAQLEKELDDEVHLP